MKIKYLAGILLLGTLFAQTPAPETNTQSKSVYADAKIKACSLTVENKILKAEHDLDQAALGKAAAEAQFQQLKQAYQQSVTQATEADRALRLATEEAWKESGLSKSDYTFNSANFQFEKKETGKK